MKKKLISLAQLVFGIGIIVFIVSKIDFNDMTSALRETAAGWPFVLIGTLSFAICLAVVIWRWKLLLDAQGMSMPLSRIVILYFVGHFFNSFLFGATGGDLVKAYLVTKETPEKKTAAVATVFIDRIIGLLALVLITTIVMGFRYKLFLADDKTKLVMIFVLCLFFGACGGMLVVFRRNIFERWSLFRKLEERTSLGKILKKVYDAFHVCVTHPGLLPKTMLLSILNHVTLVTAAYSFGHAIGIGLPFIDYLTMVPIINAIGAIPLTPGGLGTRDAACVYMMGILGVAEPKALILSLLMYASVMVWSLVGGVVYFYYIYRRGESVDLKEIDTDASE